EYCIRDFHVSGVQTCALPILDDDLALLEHGADGSARFQKWIEVRAASGVDRRRDGDYENVAFTKIRKPICIGELLRGPELIARRSEARRVGHECMCMGRTYV